MKNSLKAKKVSKKKETLKRAGKLTMSILSGMIIIGSTGSPVAASETADMAKDVLGSEGGKEALNQALMIARSKPALSIAAGITCLTCVPAAGVGASASMCVACGVLIAKTLG